MADAPVTLSGTTVPKLGRFVKMRFDASREKHVLLGPESVVVLNTTGTDILELCDGRTVDEIVSELERRYETSGVGDQVRAFLTGLAARNCVRFDTVSELASSPSDTAAPRTRPTSSGEEGS
ncbi:pyrroloquinoline quinone biosynthesis peptide chaperone PqqD [Pseudonocardia endophytica]|uniref:Pyrroloquinoline quinone biosynthesis protein D n=1 Tax=Pseudonocardia endophytica TaxID=401976 RepID=A0A4V2PIM7_PSEEN|nr:pyrroloquinoline quinone biosynthesis peptide chaperone PqqD [Pseudonocardia endophytica]TCK24736.1 pyrroloquinoline quinone biosynthesis protein D [Pseudonocardia endophytica]